jgi:hypothetical protein
MLRIKVQTANTSVNRTGAYRSDLTLVLFQGDAPEHTGNSEITILVKFGLSLELLGYRPQGEY